MSIQQTHPQLVWRYQNDPVFNRLVDTMTAAMLDNKITQDDLNNAAIVAADKVAYIRARNEYKPPSE